MTAKDTEEIAIEEGEIISDDRKEKKEKIDMTIDINRWGYVFLFLFVAILGYLIIGSFVGIPPFGLDPITQELFLTSDELLTVLIVVGLLSLLLGLYFGWFRKTPSKKEESEDQNEGIIFSDEEIEEFNDIENENKET
ncbi:MAG: hypothetical protein EAX90_02625 [Candidatus Heimdallarchaeota archaeon]|nr:hypothetical protein [Candidatus Heimdallarchaeota archaeon]